MNCGRSYLLPLLAIMWFAVGVGLIAYTLDFRREYNQYLNHRRHSLAPKMLDFERNCRDAQHIIDTDSTKRCHDLSHELDEDPEVYALYDTMFTRGMCLGYSCEIMFQKMGFGNSPLMFVVFLGIFTTLIMCALGLRITSVGSERYKQQFLPQTHNDNSRHSVYWNDGQMHPTTTMPGASPMNTASPSYESFSNYLPSPKADPSETMYDRMRYLAGGDDSKSYAFKKQN